MKNVELPIHLLWGVQDHMCCVAVQADMLERATAKFEECTETATTWDGFMAALDRKHMVMAPW